MNRLGRSAAALFICAALTVSLASCAAETNTPDTSISGPTGEITVFAAASLNGPFTELAADFEAQHPGTEIKLSFAGSSDLVTQIIAGAPADVFASADERNMTKLADADLVAGTPIDFATNTLQIVVPPANPAEVSSLADLTKPELKVVICAPQVPCGAATKTIEEAARLVLTPVSEESSVTDVLGKVRSGEADAGLVYVTDVLAAGDQVKGIEFPESSAAVNSYPIATVGTSSNQKLADAFIASVTGPEGQKMLSAAGFGTPRS
ncbi:molybdate ABC transporter substrate-binding protein [Paeniglutamicibacter gangotriensis]|uniref:Molybdenum ABC transporter periplasmic molybdate-binding protein n=1 Tax=Paeniglutamicibacter gangotriensis Lz1y TaxID=1276920 RepID=M7MZ70_9MICC|nr:molybdate ABC transporter substrate-binding protein [Paeniglutamicibacter gangotriensis]EMR00342.1 molybdenum ABC transporter periplasmic molybdate-binding protein [Paeniglutamicibacter gangotriensis Lz1y]